MACVHAQPPPPGEQEDAAARERGITAALSEVARTPQKSQEAGPQSSHRAGAGPLQGEARSRARRSPTTSSTTASAVTASAPLKLRRAAMAAGAPASRPAGQPLPGARRSRPVGPSRNDAAIARELTVLPSSRAMAASSAGAGARRRGWRAGRRGRAGPAPRVTDAWPRAQAGAASERARCVLGRRTVEARVVPARSGAAFQRFSAPSR